MLNKSFQFKTRIWPKLMSMLVVLSMVAGLAGVVGVSPAFAQATSSMVIKITGPSQTVETDTVTAAMINALPSSSVSTGNDFIYSYRDGGSYMRYYIASGAPTADILSHYTSITANDVVSATVYDDNYTVNLTSPQLVSTSTGTLDYFPNFTTPGQAIPSIIATLQAGAKGTTTTPPALPTANQMSASACLRNFYGQTSPTDAEASNSDQNITEIDITSSVDPVAVTHISLNKSVDTIAYGNTDALVPSFTPSNATNQTVIWSSDNTAVATVDQTGVVKPVAGGTANITATTAYGGFTATCAVTVTGGPTTSMIIKVNGGAPVTVTDAQILALNPANTLSYYSANGSRTFTCLGAPFANILSTYTSLTSSEAPDVSATFIGSDNYTVTIPEYTLLQTRYYYPSGGGAAVQVPPIIATAEADNLITSDPTQLSLSECLRNFIGQANATDHISNLLDQNIKEIDVTYAPAPTLAATAAPGSVSGATAATATSASGDHLGYMVSASSIPTPNVGDALPSGATNSYISGSDIGGVSAGMYVGVYELNVSNEVVKFDQITLTGNDINSSTAQPAPSVPTISPNGGSISTSDTVGIGNIAAGDTAYYTITSGDTGIMPTVSSSVYSAPFFVSASAGTFTVEAAVHDSTNGWSDPASAVFTVTLTPVNSTAGSATVSPAAGGTVSLGSEASVAIPANALNGSADVTVTITSAPSPPVAPAGYTVVGAYEFTVNGSGYTFNSPVTLTFTFNPSLIPAGTTPAVYYYDSTTSQWVLVTGGTVSGDTITVTVNHFTTFAVMAQTVITGGGGGGGGAVVVYTPTVQTEAASSITTGSAVLNGDITSDNGYNITDYGFLWGTSSSNPSNKLDVGTNNQSGAFTATLSSLTAGTTYYFKAYAMNSYGTVDGAVMSFTTAAVQAPSPVTVVPAPAPVLAQVFTDVPSTYWGYAAISSLSGQGIVSGYPDGTFKPDATVTRAEFASMLVKALGLSTAGTASQFTDVADDSWYCGSVNTAVYAGLVSGTGDHLFAPNAPITREQMAVMVSHALGTKAPAVGGTELNAFSDSSAVSSWAVTGMEEAVKAGIVSGMTAGTLAPQDNATRAQAAAMIYKLLNVLGK